MTISMGPPSIITFLVGQHRHVSLLFSQLEKLRKGEEGPTRTTGSGLTTGSDTTTSETPPKQHQSRGERAQDLVNQAVIGLMKNSAAEEIHLFPFVRERLPGGDEIADREIAALADAERTMKDLEGLEPADPRFWPAVHKLMDQVKSVVHEQEFKLFPLLQRTCSAQDLLELGGDAVRSTKMSPTRPHPNSPKEGTALQMLAPGVGLVDRLRDMFSGRGK
jgi:hypothetical protein